MMLEREHDTLDNGFAEALERYLGETLHDRIKVGGYERTARLPSFLGHAYKLFESNIAGRQCVFLVTEQDIATPSEIAKHVNLVRNEDDAIVIFATPTMSAHNRNRLIRHGVSFVVPGNQLYIPELAMDLREHFRAKRPRQADGLSPAAQAVLFHYLLRRDEYATTPSQLAERLRYSAMSVGRAFDDLVTAGLAETEKQGKERHIAFKSNRRELLDDALPHLRTPVRTEKFVRNGHFAIPLKKAGETALALLTDLSQPHTETYAVASGDWKVVSEACGFIETDRYGAELVIETWAYDPAGLADGPIVDPLSLYAQFRTHEDERAAMAAEQILENIEW